MNGNDILVGFPHPEGFKDGYYMSVFSRMEELIERKMFYEVDTEELD